MGYAAGRFNFLQQAPTNNNWGNSDREIPTKVATFWTNEYKQKEEVITSGNG